MVSTVERLGAVSNLVHGFIYFAPQAIERYGDLGLTGRQQYFAGRAAAMGPVGPGLVVATFYNFNPEVVHAAIPAAWNVAEPAAVQQQRFAAAGDVLRAACPDADLAGIGRAVELAQAMVDGVGDEGKPLAAANRSIAMPDDPVLRLWQLVTIIREWRGDAHVAALGAASVTGLEALVLHAAMGKVPAKVLRATRAWSEDAWQHTIEGLHERGLVEADGNFTSQGEQFRSDIEAATNNASQRLVDAIGDDATLELIDLLEPIRTGLLDSRVFSKPLGGTG